MSTENKNQGKKELKEDELEKVSGGTLDPCAGGIIDHCENAGSPGQSGIGRSNDFGGGAAGKTEQTEDISGKNLPTHNGKTGGAGAIPGTWN